jgi:hypothetical protein
MAHQRFSGPSFTSALRTTSCEAAEVLVTSPNPIYLGLWELDHSVIVFTLRKASKGLQLPRPKAATLEVIAA